MSEVLDLAGQVRLALEIREIASAAVASYPTSPNEDQAAHALEEATLQILDVICAFPAAEQAIAARAAIQALLTCVLAPGMMTARHPSWARPARRARVRERRSLLHVVGEQECTP